MSDKSKIIHLQCLEDNTQAVASNAGLDTTEGKLVMVANFALWAARIVAAGSNIDEHIGKIQEILDDAKQSWEADK